MNNPTYIYIYSILYTYYLSCRRNVILYVCVFLYVLSLLLSLSSLLLSLSSLILLLLLLWKLVVLVYCIASTIIVTITIIIISSSSIILNYNCSYTRSPLEDSRLFGPRPWKILRHYIWTNGFLSNPAPGENLLSGNIVMETGCTVPWLQRIILWYIVTWHTIL